MRQKIADLCFRHDIADLYVFGSRAKEVAGLLDDQPGPRLHPESDLDVGVVPATRQAGGPERRVKLSIELEDLFQIGRVDLVLLPEADPYLALDIIRGELLYTIDPDQQARCELFVLRRAGDLLPFRKERIRMILEEGAR